MPYYENLVMASARIGPTELKSLVVRVAETVMQLGGQVSRLRALPSAAPKQLPEAAEGPIWPPSLARDLRMGARQPIRWPSARPLPQPIRTVSRERHREALVFECCAFMAPLALRELQRLLRLDERVLRLVTVRRPLMHALGESAVTEWGLDKSGGDGGVSGVAPDLREPIGALERFVEEFAARHPGNFAVYDGSDGPRRVKRAPAREPPETEPPDA
ncbi:hypothetical protein CDCA_CDCA08G2388 [Cyanidium caldarium]|uniref:Uncharacterized protein n=1 Tax=Cyanidium caldarium TaxID=2771 RepID=A0AAV9IWA6_CYACA|nr:hypothetical protein CDCA_CDCA08G2388 [Cyanidium caldarium]